MINLKQSNVEAVHNFAVNGATDIVREGKLNALYNLIQKRGEPIEANKSKWNGVKVIEYKKGFYFGLRHTGFKRGCFYPCKLEQIHLEA